MADAENKTLAFAVANWLSSQSAPNADKLKQAAQLVSEAYSIDTNDAAQKAQYGKGPGLKNVWDVFMKTQAKLGGGSSSGSTSANSSATPSEQDKAKAESLKADGNKFMSSKDYSAAIASYTQAIELHATNPVYFSNRSAAYAQVGQHDKAIEDAKEASRVDPKFGKAYSRLGHALFSSGRYEEAVEAYAKGVEVDPSNALMKSGLETARQHAAKSGRASSSSGGSDGGGPVSPPSSRDVDAGAGGGFPGMGGGAGGMPDLSAMMNNPMIAQMAQSMMANGGLEQMMNNPMIQQMMSRFGGGGGGGMPDINAMMQDPQMREMARSFMGGAGGGAGAGGAGAGAGRGRGAGGGGGSNTGDDMFS